MISKKGRHVLGSLLYLVAILLLSLSSTVVHAQTSTVGNINGTVRDPQGAGVPKTDVVLKEERTGFTRTVKTDDNGFYSAPSLPIGVYTVSASPQGFKKTTNTGVELHVSESLVINLALQIGEVTETVTVTGETPQLDTTGGKVSSLVSEKQVKELPLNGRNYAALVTTIPGVSPGEGGNFAVRGTGLDSHVDMSVNGNQSNGNLWTVDGVNNMDVGSNATLLVFPSIDSIQEFRVERNSFSAEFGQAQGAVINLITKGGGNQYHGTAFEFLRNDALNSTDFFLNSARQPKQKLRYNNFGFNFNGPILKDRIFFFWSEEWRREGRGTVLSAKVPNPQERVGNFSGALTAGRPRDPFLTGGCDPKGTVNGNFGACFPNDTIPANRLSPAGLAIMKSFPSPNNPGSTNWISSALEPVATRQDSIRGDVIINSKMNLMVRFINETWDRKNASGNFWGDTPFPTLSSDWNQPSKSFAVKLSTTLTSSTVNEFQFSRSGNDIFVTTNQAGQALNDEIASKFPTVFPRVKGTGLPTVGWGTDGYPTLWHQAPWDNHQDLWVIKDDLSKVWGSHSFKAGGLFSHNIKDELTTGASGLSTVQSANGRTGNLISELLLKDLPLTQYTELDRQEKVLGRWHDFEFYGTDTWKFSPRLTVTMGMRWSRYSPTYSDNDRVSNYVLSRYDGKNPLSGLVTADKASAAGLPRSLVKPYNAGYQPRVGIAWDLFGDGKTALRLGAGRFMSRSQVIEDLLRMAGNPPWTTTVDTGWQGDTLRLADCPTCRSLDTINPGLKNAVAGVGSNTAFSAVNPDFRPPESWQWNATISREVLKDTVVEASYIGNQGTHIWRRGGSYNDVTPSARLQIAQAVRANAGNVGDLQNANRIYKGLGPVTGSESTGNSTYHAMQIWVNQRFSNRLAFQVAYTWSHAISDVPLQSYTSAVTDPFNYSLDRGDSDLDRRQMFVANGVYVLPSFKDKGAFVNHILGDWQVNAIVSLVGGVPINVTSGANTAGLAGAGSQRPNLVSGVPIYLKTSNPLQYLNPAAFSLPGVGQFGTLGRGAIRGPGLANVDFSVNKNWKVRERFGIQFRAEMFNVFNHVNLTGVDGNLSLQQVASDSNFGKSTNGQFGYLTGNRGPREIQFGLKLSF
ncbi:MAG: carboxypeptidase regulatory-like domain-containing protein [Acidobacteria bacterium]|nr:carboxypeptidase regulatory-like domain-containing protein [Acidobacteriota bacterium]